MFYQPIIEKILLLSQISPGEFKLFVYLLTYMNVEGEMWHSSVRMASVLKTGQRNIQKQLKKLESVEYVELIHNKRHSTTIRLSGLPKRWLKEWREEKDRRTTVRI
jgi:hypothetical protein